ncbi:sugar transporter [Clostridium polyendosporum]|uniref:Sugar transporter n=1 Tax=Clostridium polyendosporum TaxID=69208 RepID=A0A919VET1_9CLOT|nr:BglG family transcription antiterminator [Clostridium polyendosporum]GIM27720.1 sugar transporter [Clostridium polyendosporum]
MDLNKDCIDILLHLKEKKDFVKVTELSQKYNLTDRAIRYKIDKIEAFLVGKGFNYFERQHIKGIKLNLSPELEKYIDSFIEEYTPYQYVYSKEERFNIMLTKLLESTTPINISRFQSKLCISKNTVLKELKEVEFWLNSRGLTLNKKPKIGAYIDGDEVIKRRALTEITSQTLSSEDIVKYINTKKGSSKINSLQFEALFSEIDIDFIDSVIREAENHLNKEFSDEAYGGLITHLAIMIKRIQLNKNLYLPKTSIDENMHYKEIEVANIIVSKIQKRYSIIVPKEEANYIVFHLLGAKILKNNDIFMDNNFEVNNLYDVICVMVDEFESIYGVSFQAERNQLVDGLLLHLRPSLYRIKYSLNIINPLFNEIKLNYSELFFNTKIITKHLENYVGKSIDDHEISYIMLHFGAAMRNLEDRLYKKVRVILVCGTGIGTAKMLASQLKTEFQIQIVDTVSSRAVKNIDKFTYDFIITTVNIPELLENQYVKVNPILLPKDYSRLKSFLKPKYKNYSSLKELDLVNRLLTIVEKYCDIEDKQQLQCEFMYEIKKDNSIPLNKSLLVLSDLIKWSTIKLKENCNNWEEAIRIGCSMLIEHGYVTAEYTEAIIDNLKTIGPYMVVAPGIVLAHAKPENGVRQVCMSLLTLKYPVKFGSSINDPVRLIITFGTTDGEKHLKVLSQLMDLLNDKDSLSKIMNSISKNEVMDIITKYSK